MAAKTTTYSTVKGLNKALARLPKEASAELRTASKAIASKIADEATARAKGVGGVARFVTVKAYRDRVPVVRMGSTAKLPTEGDGWAHSRDGARQTIGDVIWGAEFGGQARDTTLQFMPHKGRTGYFLWPTVRDRSDWMQDQYSDALMNALEDTK